MAGVPSFGKLQAVLQKHRALAESCFKGDPLVDLVIGETEKRLRALTKVVFRANGDLDARTIMLRSLVDKFDLELGSCNFDVEFVSDGENGTVQFQKVLHSGWHVTIDKEEFLLLANGNYQNVLERQDCARIHHLAVCGVDLKVSLETDCVPLLEGKRPVKIVLACNDALRAKRKTAKVESNKQTEARAQLYGGMEEKSNTTERFENYLNNEDLELRELHIVFNRDPQAPQVKILSNTSESVVVSLRLLDFDADQTAIETALWSLVAKVSEKNVRRLQRRYAQNIKRASFQEKYEYWKALRSEQGATQKLLLKIFDTCLAGADDLVFESAGALAKRHARKQRNGPSPETLIAYQASNSLSTGFVSGLGGFTTMAVSIPAGLLAAWVTSARLAFAIAAIYGHDIWSPQVCAAVLYCLTGSSGQAPESDESEKEQLSPEESIKVALQKGLRRLGSSTADTTENEQDQAPPPESEKALVAAIQRQDSEPKAGLLVVNIAGCNSEDLQREFDTLYDIFGLPQTASQSEIRSAFRKMALKCHPDKVQGSEQEMEAAKIKFQVLVAAYEVLGDDKSRTEYDKSLQKGTWKWDQFKTSGLERARNLFRQFSKTNYRDPHLYVASRAVAHVTVSVAEEVASKAAVRSLAGAELRTSLAAGKSMAASASSRSTSRMIPLIGGLIAGAVDCATTANVGRYALRVFKMERGESSSPS